MLMRGVIMYKIFNIGLLGYGHVGRAAAKMLDELSNTRPVKLVKIFDTEEKKELIGPRFVSSVDAISEDPNIDIVIEALGGNAFPFETIKVALKRGKHVVTSNKTVVSAHLQELIRLAHVNNCYFQFEACCKVGIPLIKPLIELTKCDKITGLFGMLNTATNLMMSLISSGTDINTAIKEVIGEHISERDVHIDLAGIDLARKLSILSSLAFKSQFDPLKIVRFGLENLDETILKAIGENRTLRLIGEADLSEENNLVHIHVMPAIFSKNDPRIIISKESNSYLEIKTANCGMISLSGVSSGAEGASSSICGDVIRILENSGYIENVDLHNYQVSGYENTPYNYLVKDKSGKLSILKEQDIDLATSKFVARIIDDSFRTL